MLTSGTHHSLIPVVPPGLAIEDVMADHSLAVQLLTKWLEWPQSNDSQILSHCHNAG